MSIPVRRTRVFETGIDALLYVLTVIVALRVLADRSPRAMAGFGLAIAIAIVYAVGSMPVRRRRRAAALWFVGIAMMWTALVAIDVSGVYISFGLFFVALDRFTPRVGVTVVAVLTAVVVVAEMLQQPSLGVPAIVGPVIGAVVAVAMALGYHSLEHENDQRRTLIDDLHHTRAELATAEHQRGILEERERLAREIHDTVAQGLASIVILLGAAEQELRGEDVGAALDHMDQARATARTNLDEARRFVRDLAPGALDDASLEQALKRLCEDTSVPGTLKVRFTTSGTPQPLTPAVDVALLRVAQSALANVVAHSGARHSRVTLTFMADAVSLDIHDDGRGFAATPAAERQRSPGGGFGLVAMQQRLDQLGGALTVESAPGEGTVVAAAITLPDGNGLGSDPVGGGAVLSGSSPVTR